MILILLFVFTLLSDNTLVITILFIVSLYLLEKKHLIHLNIMKKYMYIVHVLLQLILLFIIVTIKDYMI